MFRVRDGAIPRQAPRRVARIAIPLVLTLALLTGGTGILAANGAFGGAGMPSHVGHVVADDPTPSVPCPGSPLHC